MDDNEDYFYDAKRSRKLGKSTEDGIVVVRMRQLLQEAVIIADDLLEMKRLGVDEFPDIEFVSERARAFITEAGKYSHDNQYQNNSAQRTKIPNRR